MQTFAPFPSYEETALCLDSLRLNKQIVEASQIFKAIHDPRYGWQNHPIVNMWRGYGAELFIYTSTLHNEWRRRRQTPDASHASFLEMSADALLYEVAFSARTKPDWWGFSTFHTSHRSQLKRKDPGHYYAFPEIAGLPYVWLDRDRNEWYVSKNGKRTYLKTYNQEDEPLCAL